MVGLGGEIPHVSMFLRIEIFGINYCGIELGREGKGKFPHSPLLIRTASQSADSILSSIKIEDCYIKELCGDKCDTGTIGRIVWRVWVMGHSDGSLVDVLWIFAEEYFLCSEQVCFLIRSSGFCPS